MKRKIVLLLSVLLAVFVLAAQAQTGEQIRDRAVAVAVQHNPALAGLDVFWEWEGFFQTNDGSLGCPFVTSFDLGYPVTPYRVELDYGDFGFYVIYVSSDPNVNVLCETPDGVTEYVNEINYPDNWNVSTTARCTASAYRRGSSPIYLEPDASSTYVGDLSNVTFFPVVGRNNDTSWYQLDLGAQRAWVNIYDVTLSGAGCSTIPITSQVNAAQPIQVHATVPQGGMNPNAIQCTLAATYANIRLLPGLSQPIVGQATRGQAYYVSGVTADNEWRQVVRADGSRGWVNQSVSNISGPGCATVPTLSETIESPPASACPFNFDGYYAPQLLLNANAQVINPAGLNLRLTPTPDGDELGRLDQGSTAFIVGGPLCENGRVWWQVPFNDGYAWIAESDFNAEQRYLNPLGTYTTIRFADIASENVAEIGRVEAGGSVVDVAFTGDGSQFAIANGTDNVVKFWSTADGETTPRILSHDTGSPMNFVDFQEGGDLAATGDAFAIVNIWQGQTIIQTMQPDFVPYFNSDVDVRPDWAQLAIGGCADGDMIAGGCTAGAVFVYNIGDGSLAGRIDGFAAGVRDVSYSPDGSTLAVLADDGTVTAYNAATVSYDLAGATGNALAYSADGASLAVAACAQYAENGVCAASNVTVFDAASAAVQTTINGPTDDIVSLAYSPDGTMLAIGSYDNTVLVWDVIGNKPLETFVGFVNGVAELDFSPDSTKLAAGDNAGIMILFNVAVQ